MKREVINNKIKFLIFHHIYLYLFYFFFKKKKNQQVSRNSFNKRPMPSRKIQL